MIVPVQIILVPLLPWFRTLHLTGDVTQYLGIVLVHVAFGAGWAIFCSGVHGGGARGDSRGPRG